MIRSIAPEVAVIDITHQIASFDVRAGGLALARSAPYLCPGIVLAVVDPGVGTARRAVAVEVGDGASVLVGPDNGVLAPAVALCGGATRAVELDKAEYHLEAPGPTFAGRDVFAPVAARLCLGVALDEVGTTVDPVTLLPGLLPLAHRVDDELVAEVLWVDHYGNAQLNLEPGELAELGERIRLRIGDDSRTARLVQAFGELGPNEVGLMVDSYGLVAVVVDERSAAGALGLGAGTPVYLSALPDDQEGGDGGVTTPVELRSTRSTDGGR